MKELERKRDLETERQPQVTRRDIAPPTPRGSRLAGRGERGEGRLALVVWLAVLALVGMGVWEVVPAKLRVDRFQDFLVQAAERANNKSQSPRIQQMILDKAKEMDLPVSDKSQVAITLTSRRVQIRVEYTLPIELPFYTYEWKKVHDVDRQVFIW